MERRKAEERRGGEKEGKEGRGRAALYLALVWLMVTIQLSVEIVNERGR